jgi:hypothetical protein
MKSYWLKHQKTAFPYTFPDVVCCYHTYFRVALKRSVNRLSLRTWPRN